MQSHHFTFTLVRAMRSPKCGVRTRKKEKASLAHRPGRLRQLALRHPSPTALGAPATGSKRKPPRCLCETLQVASIDFEVCPRVNGLPLVELRSLNPRAQCNQERKFCQVGNSLRSTKSCCRVLKLSIPSGRVPKRHKLEKELRQNLFLVSPVCTVARRRVEKKIRLWI